MIRIVYLDGTSATANVGDTYDYYEIEWNHNQYNEPWVAGSGNRSTVTYLGHTVNLPITVEKNAVASIEVVSGKVTCIENTYGYEMGNGNYYYYYTVPSDISVKVNYTDGTFKTANIKETLDGYSFSWSADQYAEPWTLGDNNFLTVSYLGITGQLPVSIIPSPVEYIEITAAPTREYVYGDQEWGWLYSDGTYEFYPTDVSGLSFTVHYTDGTSKVFTSEDIDNNRLIDGYEYSLSYDEYDAEIGDFPVTFSYMGKSFEYTVKLKKSTVASISVNKLPAITQYAKYFLPDFVGTEFTIAYTDGTTRTVVLSENNIKYECDWDYGLTYEVDVDGNTLSIRSVNEESGSYYCAYFIDQKVAIRDFRFDESQEVTSIVLGNVTSLGDNMHITVTYQDGSTEVLKLDVVVCDKYTDQVEGYAKTDKGLLYYSIDTNRDADGEVSGYEVCLLGQTIEVEEIGNVSGDGGDDTNDRVQIPDLAATGASVSFEDEIHYNIYYTAENTDDVVEMGLAIFGDRLADGIIDNAIQVIPGYVTDGNEYMVHTGGIPAKNMADMVYFKIYAKLSDGSYTYSEIAGYNAVLYAQAILKDSQNPKMKSLVVAVLNYGAEAQRYFGYNTDTLMNACLTAEQQALVDTYDKGMVADLVSADSSKTGYFPKSADAFTYSSASVSFEGAFSLNYYFTPAHPVDGEMTMYCWNAADYAEATVLTAENATGSMLMVPGVEYWGAVEGIAAKAIDETIYVAVVYTSEGVTYTSGVLAFSIGRYCEMIAEDSGSEMQFLAQATAVYGYYAKQYFFN